MASRSLPLRPPRPPSLQPSQHPAAPTGQRPWPAALWPGMGTEATVTLGRPGEAQQGPRGRGAGSAAGVRPPLPLIPNLPSPDPPILYPPAPLRPRPQRCHCRGRAEGERPGIGAVLSQKTPHLCPGPSPGSKLFSDPPGGHIGGVMSPPPDSLRVWPQGGFPGFVSDAHSLV